MDAIVCQAEVKATEIAVEGKANEEIVALTSNELSFVGGGLLGVCFA
jgi:uncharacterized protein YggU (UPF0235/DUF167 family)